MQCCEEEVVDVPVFPGDGSRYQFMYSTFGVRFAALRRVKVKSKGVRDACQGRVHALAFLKQGCALNEDERYGD